MVSDIHSTNLQVIGGHHMDVPVTPLEGILFFELVQPTQYSESIPYRVLGHKTSMKPEDKTFIKFGGHYLDIHVVPEHRHAQAYA